MADEEDLLGAMDDLGGEEEEDGSEEEGGSALMKYLPLVGGVLVVQIVIGYIIASVFFGPAEERVEEQAEMEKEEAVALAVEQEVIYEGLDPIVVNPAGTAGLRFASVHVHLGLTSQKVFDVIESMSLKSRIRDVLIQILSEKSIEELDPVHHPELKEEMRERLNDWLSPERNPPAVKHVYFQGFVLQ